MPSSQPFFFLAKVLNYRAKKIKRNKNKEIPRKTYKIQEKKLQEGEYDQVFTIELKVTKTKKKTTYYRFESLEFKVR